MDPKIYLWYQVHQIQMDPQNLPVVPVPSTSNGPQNLPVIRPNVRELPAKATVENRSQIGDVTPADSTFDETSGIDFAQIEYEGMYVMYYDSLEQFGIPLIL